MLTSELVGITRVIVRPARTNSVLYSVAVRSSPPVTASIVMSNSLPMCGSSPSGSTNSTMSSLDPGLMAFRQLPRIVKHCSSLQSRIMCDRM
jgi:hypothetical protein